jgi:hypothetical protein
MQMGLSPYGDSSGAAWIRKHLLRTVGRAKYTFDPRVLDYHRALRDHFVGEFVDYFGSPREPDETAEFNAAHQP